MSASEIKQAKSGAPYAEAILHDGPQVQSNVRLYGIPHKSSDTGLAIKIGRYKKSKTIFGTHLSLESSSPKSELTLTEEESAALLAVLRDKAGLVVTGAGQYLKVETGADVLALLKEMGERLDEIDPDLLRPLVQGNKFLPKDVLDMATLRARQDAIDEFQNLLDSAAVEASFQVWFQSNPWVFGTDCALILDERRIDVESIADYLTKAYDGHADIIEIKRPNLRFWGDTTDHGNLVPHQDLVKAITQSQNYQYELEREMDSVKMQERLGYCPIAKPRALLIHGRSDTWAEAEFRAQRLLNGGLASVQVMTYDQVLARARRVLVV